MPARSCGRRRRTPTRPTTTRRSTRRARSSTSARTTTAADAIALLGQAITAQPDEPVAYQLRGTAYLQLRDWAHCAEDLAAAALHVHHDETVKWELRRDLGICQARAGKLADAERTLADAAAAGATNPELWLRLGETRIAMGKLDEARAALDAAIEHASNTESTQMLWMRALADDRARQPSAAEDDVHRALGFDSHRTMIETPPYPLLGDGEQDYLLGLSYADSDPRDPELATVYFRHFVELAPKSPWRRRAEEHLHELRTVELPLAVVKQNATAAVDADAAAKAVRVAMPKLRACLAKLPGVVLDVRVTRAGPRTPNTSPNLPHYQSAPPDGAAVTERLVFDATKSDIDVAVRCVQPIAEAMAMPAVTEHDKYYAVSFRVIQ